MGEAEAIERLRRLQELAKKAKNEGYDRGKAEGVRWVYEVADLQELRSLELLDPRTLYSITDTKEDDCTPAEYVFLFLHSEESDRSKSTPFWTTMVGDDQHLVESKNFLRGFVEGAKEAWAKIKPQL